MSEFQQYQFQSIDRLPTDEERQTVSSWSSRAQVTSSSATFIYHYGDFRQKPEKVLAEYFQNCFSIF